MTWYLYGFAAGMPTGLPCGVGGRPVFAAMADEICLLISHWDDEPAPSLTGAAVLAHEEVVEAAMEACAVLPCRFGTVVEHAYCLDFVATHADEIHARLQAVTGQVEVTLKVFDRTSGSRVSHGDGARSGTAYLLRKQVNVHQEQARAKRATTIADEIDAVLTPWATDRHRQFVPAGEVLLAMTYLIPAAATPAWTAAAESLRDRFADYDLLATGPWPPYHFTEGKTRDGRTFEPDPGTAR
jgi:hypothetical protein